MTIVNTIVNTVRTVPLPADPRDVPSLSLHVLAKNAESVLGRLLDNVGAYVQELRFVLNDTTDASEKVLRRWVETRKSRGLETTTPLHVDHVTSETHPHFYILDVAATYEVGSPLDGEHFEGPFTGRPLLADWALRATSGGGRTPPGASSSTPTTSWPTPANYPACSRSSRRCASTWQPRSTSSGEASLACRMLSPTGSAWLATSPV